MKKKKKGGGTFSLMAVCASLYIFFKKNLPVPDFQQTNKQKKNYLFIMHNC